MIDLLNIHLDDSDGIDYDYIAILSDKIDCGTVSEGKLVSADTGNEPDLNKLLELRVFNENREYRAYRDNLSELSFEERIVSDDPKKYSSCYDELQYLDRDDKRITAEGKGNELFATGGGRYFLPEKAIKKRKVLVRTYLKADDYGMEYAADWRIVGYRDAALTSEEDQNG